MLTLAYLRPEEGQSIWPKRRQGFQPCFEAGIRELPFLITQVVRLLDATEEEWEISRSEVELGDKLGQGNYGAVFKGQLTVTAMTPKIHTHKKEMDFEGKSHLSVAVKMLRSKCIAELLYNNIICCYSNVCSKKDSASIASPPY